MARKRIEDETIEDDIATAEEDETEEEELVSDDDEEWKGVTTTDDESLRIYDPVSNTKAVRWLLTEPALLYDPDVPGHVYVERTETWALFVVPHARTFDQFALKHGNHIAVRQNVTTLVALTAIYGALLRLTMPPYCMSEQTSGLRLAIYRMLTYHDGTHYVTDSRTWDEVVKIVQSNSRILVLGHGEQREMWQPNLMRTTLGLPLREVDSIYANNPYLRLTIRPYGISHVDSWKSLLLQQERLDHLFGSLSITLNARYFFGDIQ